MIKEYLVVGTMSDGSKRQYNVCGYDTRHAISSALELNPEIKRVVAARPAEQW
jgi:hypothetical protein